MKKTIQIPAIAFAASLFTASANAAVVNTIDVLGAAPGLSSSTFTNYSTGGGAGGGAGTRIGMATSASGAGRVIAGTSNASAWTITGAGTITVSYYLANTINNANFIPGIQGLYDASGGIAADASGVSTALNDFAAMDGVSMTLPTISGLNNTITDALFTTTYTIDEGSEAIGKEVAIGFYSTWNNAGSYIFGRENQANQVVIDFVAIPEPSAALLGAFGMLALLRRRR